MRNKQAKPTEAFFALQHQLREHKHHLGQLEQLVMQQRALIDELCSVACAWCWDRGAGVPELTDAQKRLIIENDNSFELPKNPEPTNE